MGGNLTAAFNDFMHGPLYLTEFGLHFTGSRNGIPNTGDRKIPFFFFSSGVNFRLIFPKRTTGCGVGSCLQHHYGTAWHGMVRHGIALQVGMQASNKHKAGRSDSFLSFTGVVS